MINYVVIGKKGQITIPVALRRSLKLQPGDQLEISDSLGDIVLTPYERRCVLCSGKSLNMEIVRGCCICPACINTVKAM